MFQIKLFHSSPPHSHTIGTHEELEREVNTWLQQKDGEKISILSIQAALSDTRDRSGILVMVSYKPIVA